MDRGSIYYLSDTLKYDERNNVILRIFFTLLNDNYFFQMWPVSSKSKIDLSNSSENFLPMSSAASK